MDDTTAFDRLLVSELHQMAGPGRQIDAMAMVREVATRPPDRRSQTMFSAARFVLAGAIVALWAVSWWTGVSPTRRD